VRPCSEPKILRASRRRRKRWRRSWNRFRFPSGRAWRRRRHFAEGVRAGRRTVPAVRATPKASFTWPRICGSPTTMESRLAATGRGGGRRPDRDGDRCGARGARDRGQTGWRNPVKIRSDERLRQLRTASNSTRLQVETIMHSETPAANRAQARWSQPARRANGDPLAQRDGRGLVIDANEASVMGHRTCERD
jgi:hypothetical protein